MVDVFVGQIGVSTGTEPPHAGHFHCSRRQFRKSVLSPTHSRLLLRGSIAAIVLAVITHTRADPDLFGHVRFGQDLVAARSVHLADPYSFVSDRAWINHEWLSEAVMYAAYAAAGNAGLIVLKLLLLAAMLAAVIVVLRRSELTPIGYDALIALVAICTFPQANHVRPQLFSLALFAWLLLALTGGRPLRSIPIMAIWVNLHGGWLVGAGTIAAWAATGLLTAEPARAKFTMLGVGAASVLVTLLNPYGWQMWSFLRETVGFGRADITDWQPVFALGRTYGLLWLITAAAAVAGVWKARTTNRQLGVPSLVVIAMFAVASFRVSRLLSFFTIGTVMLAGPHIAAWFDRSSATRSVGSPSRLATGVVTVLALALLVGGLTLSARNLSCIRMEEALFPEPGVAEVVSARGVRGRMLTWFDWGEYAIWYFWPNVKVSMDGRRETVYSDAAIQRHWRFYFLPDDRASVLADLKPDYIWIPSNLDVTAQLLQDGWLPLFAGPRSTLLAQKDRIESAGPPVSGPNPARCFPGP
jgi:hypothetical protein